MSQAQQPLVPTSGATPQEQRFLAGMGEFVRSILRLGIFLTRSDVGKIATPAYGVSVSLKWGSMNRLLPSADCFALLPRIMPENIGVPLDVVLLKTGNVATLIPTGTAGSDGRSKPLINGVGTLNINATGLYTLKTDGTNWFVGKGV